MRLGKKRKKGREGIREGKELEKGGEGNGSLGTRQEKGREEKKREGKGWERKGRGGKEKEGKGKDGMGRD